MIKTPISLHDLRKRIYNKAKADKTWRFWGLFVHVCKMETLQIAYEMARHNDGAPGIDGVTFEAIEEKGVEAFLKDIRNGLITIVDPIIRTIV
jgi:RNA-directed DNA polymerase